MPPRSTIFGHEELNRPGFHCTKAVEWAKQYGPVYRLNLNFTDVVVLSDVQSIKKFCKNADGFYRLDCFIVGRGYNKDTVSCPSSAITGTCRGILPP
ncbi:hypothetical protein MRX96_057073 [Rhipicephalus microplus]